MKKKKSALTYINILKKFSVYIIVTMDKPFYNFWSNNRKSPNFLESKPSENYNTYLHQATVSVPKTTNIWQPKISKL